MCSRRSRPDYVEDSECENGHDDDDDDHDSTIDDDESDFEFAYKCSVCFKRFKDVLTLRAHSMIHLFEKKSSGELLKVKEETTPTVKPEVKGKSEAAKFGNFVPSHLRCPFYFVQTRTQTWNLSQPPYSPFPPRRASQLQQNLLLSSVQ